MRCKSKYLSTSRLYKKIQVYAIAWLKGELLQKSTILYSGIQQLIIRNTDQQMKTFHRKSSEILTYPTVFFSQLEYKVSKTTPFGNRSPAITLDIFLFRGNITPQMRITDFAPKYISVKLYRFEIGAWILPWCYYRFQIT